MALTASDLIGAVAGNQAAEGRVLDDLAQQKTSWKDQLRGQLGQVGQQIGSVLGTDFTDALAEGAQKAETDQLDQLAKDKTGFTLTGMKGALTAAAVGVVMLLMLAWNRRRGR